MGAQVAEQVGEGGLEGVVVFPVREVGDVVFAEFDGQVFAGAGVEAAPVADAVDAHQPDGEQFLAWALLAEFGLARAYATAWPPSNIHSQAGRTVTPGGATC